MTDPKFPGVHVTLLGASGEAFAILGRVSKAMRRAGCSREDVEAYVAEATSGDYDHLLQVTMATVEVE